MIISTIDEAGRAANRIIDPINHERAQRILDAGEAATSHTIRDYGRKAWLVGEIEAPYPKPGVRASYRLCYPTPHNTSTEELTESTITSWFASNESSASTVIIIILDSWTQDRQHQHAREKIRQIRHQLLADLEALADNEGPEQ